MKWSLDELGGHGVLFAGYTSSITRIETSDPETVVIHTKRPDARIIGGLFVYVLPELIRGKVPLKQLKGKYQPKLPIVGSHASSLLDRLNRRGSSSPWRPA